LSRGARWLISGLLLFHLGALFVGPWAVPPASVMAERGWRFYRPYLEAAFLNHGYNFFAPEPGPSHLLKYELVFADGKQSQGIIPDLVNEQPRLRYHRHFMLTEWMNNALVAEDNRREQLALEGKTPSEMEQLIRHEGSLAASYARSYADHLLTTHGAARVTLTLRRHAIPSPDDVAKGQKLDDPSLYQERPLGVYAAGKGRIDPPPAVEAEVIPAAAEVAPARPAPSATRVLVPVTRRADLDQRQSLTEVANVANASAPVDPFLNAGESAGVLETDSARLTGVIMPVEPGAAAIDPLGQTLTGRGAP
jgi:hypothetical protein